jgi:hypothetical protein
VRVVGVVGGLGHGAMGERDGLPQIIATVREFAPVKTGGLSDGDGRGAIRRGEGAIAFKDCPNR